MEDDRPIDGEIIDAGSAAPEGGSGLPAPARPDSLYVLPLNEKPFFPAQTLPLIMNEGPWLETVQNIGENQHHLVGLLLARPESADEVTPDDFYGIGTLVRMHHPVRGDGKIQFIAEGVTRFKVLEWLSDKAPYQVRVAYPMERRTDLSDEVKAYAVAIINTIKELMPLNPLYSEELKFFLKHFSPNEPSPLADFAATLTTATKENLQEVLETRRILKPRLEKVLRAASTRSWKSRARRWRSARHVDEKMQRAAARVLPARAAEGDPEGAGPRQGRPDRRGRELQRAAGAADRARARGRSASTRK